MRPVVYIIDRSLDNLEEEQETRENLAEFCPNLLVLLFSSPADALSHPCPDAIVVDVGTLAGIMPQPEFAVRITENILAHFECATAFITSAVGGWADMAVESLALYAPAPLPGCISEWPAIFSKYGIDAVGGATGPDDARHRACRLCGCTEDRACPQGCAWDDDDPTICTACVQTADLAALHNLSVGGATGPDEVH